MNTAADNLRGQGPTIRDTVIKLSQAMSALGDHSTDIFSTVKNLSILVSALQSSGDLLRNLNVNLAATTGLLANQPTEIADAVASINGVLDEVKTLSARTGKPWARHRTNWPRSPVRSPRASRTSSRHCTSRRAPCRTM